MMFIFISFVVSSTNRQNMRYAEKRIDAASIPDCRLLSTLADNISGPAEVRTPIIFLQGHQLLKDEDPLCRYNSGGDNIMGGVRRSGVF